MIEDKNLELTLTKTQGNLRELVALTTAGTGPDCALTNEDIGRILNQVYDHYFTKKTPNELDRRIAESFLEGEKLDNFFWCRKLGPRDTKYQHQVAIMKTIASFGAQPEYRLSRTDEVLRSIDDLDNVSEMELLYDLKHDRGLRGWLAVMYHENPNVKMTENQAFEKLLEQYVKTLGRIDPDNDTFIRFNKVKEEVDTLNETSVKQIKETRTINTVQKLMAILLGLVPMVLLLIDLIFIMSGKAKIIMPDWVKFISFGIGAVAFAFSMFKFQCPIWVGLIIGAVVGVISFRIFIWIMNIYIYFYGLAVLSAIVYFTIFTLLYFRHSRPKIKRLKNPSPEVLLLEPLKYAFSKTNNFESSINETIGVMDDLRENEIRQQWIRVLIFVGVSVALNLLRFSLPDVRF